MEHSHENRPLTHILKFNPNLDAEFYASVCLDWEKWFKAQKEELQQLKQDRAKLGEWIRLHPTETLGELLDEFIDEILGTKP